MSGEPHVQARPPRTPAPVKTRVGRIPYLNSEVFYSGMAAEGIELVSLVPSALSAAAREGRVDAGPVPLVTCFELEDRFEPLGDYCIATVERARSIILFCKRPIERLDDAVVGVTGETSTSVRLLKTLLTHRFKVAPRRYVPVSEDTDAFLLIGDDALRNRGGVPSYPHLYDLGEEWRRWTGLPFVFARWMARRDASPEAVARLDGLLSESVKRGLAGAEAIAGKRRDLSMSRAEVVEYVRSFHYRLGAAELEAIARFRDLLDGDTAAARLIPSKEITNA